MTVSSETPRNRDTKIPHDNTLKCGARFLTDSPQPSCFRDADLHHPDTCTLTVAVCTVPSLPVPIDQQRWSGHIVQNFSA